MLSTGPSKANVSARCSGARIVGRSRVNSDGNTRYVPSSACSRSAASCWRRPSIVAASSSFSCSASSTRTSLGMSKPPRCTSSSSTQPMPSGSARAAFTIEEAYASRYSGWSSTSPPKLSRLMRPRPSTRPMQIPNSRCGSPASSSLDSTKARYSSSSVQRICPAALRATRNVWMRRNNSVDVTFGIASQSIERPIASASPSTPSPSIALVSKYSAKPWPLRSWSILAGLAASPPRSIRAATRCVVSGGAAEPRVARARSSALAQ